MACKCGGEFRLLFKRYRYLKLPMKRTICVKVYVCSKNPMHIFTPIDVWEPVYLGRIKGKDTYKYVPHKEEVLTEEEIKIREKQEPATIVVKRGGCGTCGHSKNDHAMGIKECHQRDCNCQHFKTKQKEMEVTI